jgi:hypothetical protein
MEKLHSVELHSLYSSPNIVRVIKSRRMRWAGHVARMGGRGEVDVGGRMTLRWTLGRQESVGRTGFGWLRIVSSGGLL